MLIDVVICGDRNEVKKDAEKILKYKDLIKKNRNAVHVECESKIDTGNNRGDWNHLKITQTVPEQHTGKHEIKELQKTAILDTSYILWKVLMWKYKMFVIGNVITCTVNCSYRMSATVCTVETWIALGV